jgi:DNA primase
MSSKRADRIKQHITIVELLHDYGYLASADERKQQFRCDLHGDTRDGKPSARVYPEEGHAYCFACGKSRDVIGWTMEKESVNFTNACLLLERRYHLPVWTYEDRTRPEAVVEEDVTPDFKRLESLVNTMLQTNSIPLRLSTLFYESVDMAKYRFEHGLTGKETQAELDKIREKLLDKARGAA